MVTPLKKYLDNHNLKISDFSKKVGIPQPSLSRYLAGRVPRKAEMYKIYIATNGAVTPNDFYDLPLLESERSQLDFFKPVFHPPSFPESQTHNPQQTDCQPCPAA